jgi:MFS transporter, OCT family, solute carrier family 22 (organic cation transporter), member 4/5
MHFAGIMAGSAIFGVFADYFGRKKIFIIAIIFMSLTGVGQAVSNSYLVFTIFAFLNAVGTSGVYPLAFILGVEMVGKGKREMAGVILNYFYSLGQALVGVIAWIDGDWVNLQYWVSAPPILFIVYYWIIPESARWLMAKNRNRKAFKIIRKVAKNNGKELSQSILEGFHQEMAEESAFEKNSGEQKETRNKKAAYKRLLQSRVMVIRCLILFFIW